MTTSSKLTSFVGICIFFLAQSAQATHLSGSWSTKAPMPTARSASFVAAVDGKLYVAGGIVSGALNVLERYDPTTDTWTSLAPMPGARYQGGVAVLGSNIYVLGGWDAPATFLPTSTVQIYDTLTNTWSAGPSMPILSSSGPTGVIGGKIYKHTAEHGSSSASRQLHVLDPVAGTWTALANLPNDHAVGAAGVSGGKLYIAGGTDFGFGSGGGTHAQVHAYDPVTNTWSTLTSAPTARAGLAGDMFGDHLLVAGGGSPSGTILGTFEAYDTASDTWSTLPSMPLPLSSSSGTVIGNTFYVVGGFDGVNRSNALQAFTIPEPAMATLATFGLAFAGLSRLCRRRRC